MAERQHDHHCTIRAGDTLWRVAQMEGRKLLVICEHRCCRAQFDLTNFNSEAYAVETLILDSAETLRAERGSIPSPTSRRAH